MSDGKNGNGHRLASLEELLALPLPFEDVDIPEYGEGVQIRLHAVTGLERTELAGVLKALDTKEPEQIFRFQCTLLAASLHSTPEAVGQLSAAVIDRLATAALRLTGLNVRAVAEAEEVLKATPSGDSG